MNEDNELGDLQDLGVFVAVADAGGFSAAARRIGVSKAMVSTAVTRLERRLGVRLLQRSTRRLALTEAGAAYLDHARQARLAARAAEAAATEARETPRGLLRINVPMSFGLLHVMPALAAFAQQYPEVEIDVSLEDRVVDLLGGGFDLAIRVGQLVDSNLVAYRFGASRSVLVATPAYLDRQGVPAHPRELAAHRALVYTLAAAGNVMKLAKDGETETVRRVGHLRVNNTLALRQAVLADLGIARIPSFVVAPDIASGALMQVLPDWKLPELGIHAVYPSREYLPRKTRAFIDFFAAHLGDPPYWDRVFD